MPGMQHGRRRRALTALRLEQPRDRGGVERVGGEAVDRVGREHHELAAPDRGAREPHAREQLGIDRTVVDGSHDRSILDPRACHTRGMGTPLFLFDFDKTLYAYDFRRRLPKLAQLTGVSQYALANGGGRRVTRRPPRPASTSRPRSTSPRSTT